MGRNRYLFHNRLIRRCLIHCGFRLIKAFGVHDSEFQLLISLRIVFHFFRRTPKTAGLGKIPFFKNYLHLLVCLFQFLCENGQLAAQFFFLLHTFKEKLQDIFFIQFFQLFF